MAKRSEPYYPTAGQTRITDPLFELPLPVVLILVPLFVIVVAFVAAWSIYLIGSLGIPFDQICRLWPPGWKCP